MDTLICYCFNYTEADIQKDVLAHGTSTIAERIRAEKKSGGCQCRTKNPEGI